MKTKSIITSAFIGAIAATGVYAAGENIVTSKGYVDNRIDTRQAKIPATNTNSATPGSSVVTYTSSAGTIGERGIYDGSQTYNSTNDVNKLATAAALNSAVTNLPTMATTKLTCANPDTCDLWTIDSQTVYGNVNSGSN